MTDEQNTTNPFGDEAQADDNQAPASDDGGSNPFGDDAQSDDGAAKTSGPGVFLQADSNLFVIPDHPKTKFDDQYFLSLLQGSISLTVEEKQRVIDAIPRLEQAQIDELVNIFEEERQKFAELEGEFSSDIEKLKNERTKEMEQAAEKQAISHEESEQSDEDEEEAARVRREAGLE